MPLLSFWRDLSISKKIYFVVGALALLIAAELVALNFTVSTLSAVRAFVGGESRWSKGHKQAVANLHNYILSKERRFYDQFLESLRVPLGDKKARLELEKDDPDLEVIFNGFREGEVHPDDIPGVTRLMRRFKNYSYLKAAVATWTMGDQYVSELLRLGESLKKKVDQAAPANEIAKTYDQVEKLDAELTVLTNKFSILLGEGSRNLEQLLILVFLLTTFLVGGASIVLTLIFVKHLSRSLSEINCAALELANGQFSTNIEVRSKDELGQLARTFNKMAHELLQNIGGRQQAETVSQFKSMFLANMSHEIRTPLSAIIGFSGLLKNPNLSSAERLKYLEVVERTGLSLTQIVDDILDLSKVEAGKLDVVKKDMSLSDLLRELYEVLVVRAQAKKLKLDFEIESSTPWMIQTDPCRLKQILLNLLVNSIKFTTEGSVKLNVKRTASQLVFTITDTGVGMNDELKSRLFLPFSIGDSAHNRNFQGTGLGLALSQKLAQALGGEIVLQESQLGKGSSFSFSLDLNQCLSLSGTVLQRSASHHFHITASFDGKKILIIDDSEDNQILLSSLFSKEGFKVSLASNGVEGISAAMSDQYDFVIMDMQMPIMDGYQATRELRQRGYRVPIIAITASAMKEDRERCIEVGCNEYFSKPIHIGALLEFLSQNSKSIELIPTQDLAAP